MEPTVTPQVSDQGNGSIDGSKKRSEAETSSAADAIDQQIKRSKLGIISASFRGVFANDTIRFLSSA